MAAMTLFNSLPRNAQENVLRQLSSVPVLPNWRHFEQPLDSLRSVHPSHPLSEAA